MNTCAPAVRADLSCPPGGTLWPAGRAVPHPPPGGRRGGRGRGHERGGTVVRAGGRTGVSRGFRGGGRWARSVTERAHRRRSTGRSAGGGREDLSGPPLDLSGP